MRTYTRLAYRAVAVFLFLAWALCHTACDHSSAPPAPAATVPQAVQRANPASENCVAMGGRHSVEANPAGGQFGVCLFEDNRQCEEWALLRVECPKGGIKVTGFATPSARYCGIAGGKYSVTANSGAPDEKGTCTLPGSKVCDADEYFSQGSACPAKSRADFDGIPAGPYFLARILMGSEPMDLLSDRRHEREES